MSETKSVDQEPSAAEKLADTLGDYQLGSEGRIVWASVASIEEFGGDGETVVRVTAELPDGETFSEEFDYPVPWTTDNRFVRLVERQGYDPSSIHFMEGENIEVYKHPIEDEWRFYVDRSDRFWSISLLDVTVDPDIASLKIWGAAMTLSTGYLALHHLPPIGMLIELISLTLIIVMGILVVSAMASMSGGM